MLSIHHHFWKAYYCIFPHNLFEWYEYLFTQSMRAKNLRTNFATSKSTWHVGWITWDRLDWPMRSIRSPQLQRAHDFANILQVPELESPSPPSHPQICWVGWSFVVGGERLVARKKILERLDIWMDGCFVFFQIGKLFCFFRNWEIELMKWRFFLKSSWTQTQGLIHSAWFLFIVWYYHWNDGLFVLVVRDSRIP